MDVWTAFSLKSAQKASAAIHWSKDLLCQTWTELPQPTSQLPWKWIPPAATPSTQGSIGGGGRRTGRVGCSPTSCFLWLPSRPVPPDHTHPRLTANFWCSISCRVCSHCRGVFFLRTQGADPFTHPVCPPFLPTPPLHYTALTALKQSPVHLTARNSPQHRGREGMWNWGITWQLHLPLHIPPTPLKQRNNAACHLKPKPALQPKKLFS